MNRAKRIAMNRAAAERRAAELERGDTAADPVAAETENPGPPEPELPEEPPAGADVSNGEPGSLRRFFGLG